MKSASRQDVIRWGALAVGVILFIAAFTSIFGVAACGGQGDVNEAEQDVKEAE